MTASLDDVRRLDAADPLARFRSRFVLPDGIIYLNGNSLGPLTLAARNRLAAAVDSQWGQDLSRSWDGPDWMPGPARIGDKIARLIGAAAGEVTVADSTSVNLYKLISAALTARPGRRVVLSEAGNFPTDLYIANGAANALGAQVKTVARDELFRSIDGETAVVALTHVHYKTAARWDMGRVTAAAHAVGALMLWDLSHSVGAIGLDLGRCGADLAVGCGYKFLNGGPGAPAFLFVASALQEELVSPLSGWMGHAAPFDFVDDYRPARGITRFQCGTPPILALAALEAGVDLALEAPVDALSVKAEALWGLFAELMAARLANRGFQLITPSDPEARGSQIAYTHPESRVFAQALAARNVIADFREPDVLRFGLAPLYVGYEDIWRAVDILAEIAEAAGGR